MQFRQLGKDGPRMPVIGLSAWPRCFLATKVSGDYFRTGINSAWMRRSLQIHGTSTASDDGDARGSQIADNAASSEISRKD